MHHPGEENRLVGMLPIGRLEWIVLRREDGFYECRGFTPDHREGSSMEKCELVLSEEAGTTSRIELLTLVAPEWSTAIRQELGEVSQ